MKLRLLILFILLAALSPHARGQAACVVTAAGTTGQTCVYTGPTTLGSSANITAGVNQPHYTVAALPSAASNSGLTVVVTDGTAQGSCTSGGGTFLAYCYSNGSAWLPLGDGGASSSGGGTFITPQQYGAIANGSTHPVSSWCTNHGGTRFTAANDGACLTAIQGGGYAFITAITQEIDYAAIQAMLVAVQAGTSTSRHMILAQGIYMTSTPIAIGASATSPLAGGSPYIGGAQTFKSAIFEGEGTYDNYGINNTVIRWNGAANGTILQCLGCQNVTIQHILLDGGGNSPGYGFINTTLNTVGSNHENIYNDIAVAGINGTPGVGIYNGGSYLVNNQDISDTSWSNMHVYAGIGTTTTTGFLQDGIQTVNHQWFGNNSFSGYTSRGMDFRAGSATVSGANFSTNNTTLANVDDVYVASTMYWVTFENTEHEITACTGSCTNATRHAFNFPTGSHPYATLLKGVRVYWTLSSGNPIYSNQTTGPISLVGCTFDGPGTGSLSFAIQPNLVGVSFSSTLTNGITPTITTHFNTSSDSVLANSLPSAFTVTIGTGAGTTTGVLGFSAAPTGWNCTASNMNRAAIILQTASSTTSATLTNYAQTAGVTATNWTNSDVLHVSCFAY